VCEREREREREFVCGYKMKKTENGKRESKEKRKGQKWIAGNNREDEQI